MSSSRGGPNRSSRRARSRASWRTWVRPTTVSGWSRCARRRASCWKRFTNSHRYCAGRCTTSIISTSRNGRSGSACCSGRSSIPIPHDRTISSTERARTRMTQPVVSSSKADRGWFGHPRGLSTLFFTEMWERFSFYGLRALLVLYMTAAVANGGLAFTAERASNIVGWYGFGAYAAAIPGGWTPDRLLGQYRSVVLGGVRLATVRLRMAMPRDGTRLLGLRLGG